MVKGTVNARHTNAFIEGTFLLIVMDPDLWFKA